MTVLALEEVEDLHRLPAGEVLELLAGLVTERNRLDAQIAGLARHAELTQAVEHDGLVSVRSWLIGHLRLSAAEASRIARTGRAAERFPRLAAGFASGAVTAAQVDVVASAVGEHEQARAAEQDVDLAPFDAAWTAVATSASHQSLAVAVRAFEDALDPDGEEPDPTEGRRLSIARHADGSVSGRFELDAVGGEKVQAALESVVQANRPQGDRRTRTEQQADAFVQVCATSWLRGTCRYCAP